MNKRERAIDKTGRKLEILAVTLQEAYGLTDEERQWLQIDLTNCISGWLGNRKRSKEMSDWEVVIK